MKQAANIKKIQKVFSLKPKIIHISCHGATDDRDDIPEDEKQFYLMFEDYDNYGLEKKFYLNDLKLLIESNTEIKIAFISACFSEEIGQIFFESGVPVVIAVNSK